jgi:exopolysaccharide biosynthesis protein
MPHLERTTSLLRRLDPVSSVALPALVATIVLLAAPSAAPAGTSVAFQRLWIAGVRVNVITADLNNPNVSVTPAVARRGIGSCESFRSMMRRTRPAAAVNGTFFDTVTLKPTGDIVIDGRLLCKGDLGVAIGITANNVVRFIPSRHPDMYRWYEHDSVIVAGPTLVTQGKAIVVPRDEGFRSSVHFRPRVRAAVGLTSANKLILATTTRGVYLSRLARVMRALRCREAAALDGGSSAGLYFKGKLIMNPTRGMTNCLLVYDDPADYELRRAGLCPGGQCGEGLRGGS